MIPAAVALAVITLTAATLYRKKIISAVFYLITVGLAALAWLFHAATPRERPAARHAADDGQDWADALRAIASPLRKRVVPPAAVARARVQAVQSVLGQRGCRMELCKYWPGEGCMRGVMPCDFDGDVSPAFEGLPAADVDMYLTEHAEQYKIGFDRDFPALAGELVPPWIGPRAGDIQLDAPMTYVAAPPLAPLPPARACPDVPTVIIPWQGEVPPELIEAFRAAFNADVPGAPGTQGGESGQAPCLCGIDPGIPGEPITSEAGCPAHGHLWDGNCGCPECCRRAPAEDVPQPHTHDSDWAADACPVCFPPAEDVPGLAEHASPTPPGGAEAATAAASAGPGTPTHDDGPGSSADRAPQGPLPTGSATEDAGSTPAPDRHRAAPDVTNLDDTGCMKALTDWALHAPLDQVKAASR